jgi:proteasome accessory factor A
LHLIHGDTNVLPCALFLKVGTTRLVLDLLEAEEMPPVALADAVTSLRSLSRTPRPPWRVALANGRTGDALELLSLYHQKAQSHFAGRDEETDAILRLWKRVLSGLATNPESLVGVLDWVSKKYLLGKFCAREGLSWSHPWLESQDLEFHHIDPERSFGLAMGEGEGLWTPVDVERAMREAPTNSRAHARSRLMRELQTQPCSYHVDWAEVLMPNERRAMLPNPFQT